MYNVPSFYYKNDSFNREPELNLKQNLVLFDTSDKLLLKIKNVFELSGLSDSYKNSRSYFWEFSFTFFYSISV